MYKVNIILNKYLVNSWNNIINNKIVTGWNIDLLK